MWENYSNGLSSQQFKPNQTLINLTELRNPKTLEAFWTIFAAKIQMRHFLMILKHSALSGGPIAKPKIQAKNSFLLLNGLFEQFVDGHHGWVIIKHSEFSLGGPPFYSHDHMSRQRGL